MSTRAEDVESREYLEPEIRTVASFRLLAGLCTGSLFFVIGTGIVYGLLADVASLSSALSKPAAILILSQLNLSSENTLATWYSSMVLLITGAVACLCYLARRTSRENRGLKKGWLLLAFFFTVLSLDELGSLHKNAGRLVSPDVFGTATWESVLLVPLAVILGFLVIFAFREVKWHSAAFWLMAAGALLLLSIPAQEYLETRMWNSNDEGWTRPVSLVLIEEGSELLASVFFIAAMAVYLLPESSPFRIGVVRLYIRPQSFRRILAGSLIVFSIGFIFIYLTGDYLGSDDGIAINWFPAASALVLFMVLLLFRVGRTIWILSYLVLLSGYYGSNFYALIHWGQIALLSYLVRVVMLAGLVYFAYALSSLSRDTTWRVTHLAGSLLIGSGFVIAESYITFVVTAGFMMIVYQQMRRFLISSF